MACDQCFKRVAKRSAVAEPDLAVVPMATFEAGDEAECFLRSGGAPREAFERFAPRPLRDIARGAV